MARRRTRSPEYSSAVRASLLLLLAARTAAASSLSGATVNAFDPPRGGFLQDVLESKAADQKYCKPTGQIHDACCDYETVEQVNTDLFGRLHHLVQQPYFRYHKVDLAKECPFWEEDGSCMNRACGVETTDETSPAGCQEISDSDFCVLEDELDSEGVYVDLLENPERFTGYAGPSSARVWKAIYEENCFAPVPFIDPSRATWEGGSGFAHVPMSSSEPPATAAAGGLGGFGGLTMGGWGEAEKRLMGSLAGPKDPTEEVCLEKRVFYRVISGLHASISVHICDDYLDQQTGEWAPNLDCFITRIGQHPERLENMYFTYVLLLRALARSGPQLVRTLEETAGELDTRDSLKGLVQVANGCPSTFDETSMFSGKEAELLKYEFKDHFRNVSRIMDCVGCDKCRLWGKLQITGLGTALKLLFSYDGASALSNPLRLASSDVAADPNAVALSRSELVAFVNTLHRLSESLAAVDKFRVLWARRHLREEKQAQKDKEAGGAAASLPRRDRAVDASAPIANDGQAVQPTTTTARSRPASSAREKPSSAAAKAPSKNARHRASGPSAGRRVANGTELRDGAMIDDATAGSVAAGIWTRFVTLCEGGWSRCVEFVGKVGVVSASPASGTAAGAEEEGGQPVERDEL
ncbi:endoplasmic oxidoreductin-1 [Rhodotorula sphaerocarpa]